MIIVEDKERCTTGDATELKFTGDEINFWIFRIFAKSLLEACRSLGVRFMSLFLIFVGCM